MSILSSKLLIGCLVIIAILVLLYFIGNKSVRASVTIQGSPEKVWEKLTNMEEVKQWNQVLVPLQGEMKEGATINYRFFQEEGGKPSEMNARVVSLEPQSLIHQRGGIPGVITFNHHYRISPQGDKTEVLIEENYRGIMVPFWDPAPVESAYVRLLNHLKDRMEDGTDRED